MRWLEVEDWYVLLLIDIQLCCSFVKFRANQFLELFVSIKSSHRSPLWAERG